MFYSILFPDESQHSAPRFQKEPDCFKDLNLGQIFERVIPPGLEDIYYTPPQNLDCVTYRQEIIRELDNRELRELFYDFSEAVRDLSGLMTEIRKALSYDDRTYNNYLTRGHMLDYAEIYCGAISEFSEKFTSFSFKSRGLSGFAEYFQNYCASSAFTDLCRSVQTLRSAFDEIEYCMLIRNNTVRVRKYENQPDHSKQLLECFEKFRQGGIKEYRYKPPEEPVAEHIEAALLELLSRLYRETFSALDDFSEKFFHFDDDIITGFSIEIQFYLSWLDLIYPLREKGLPFNCPNVNDGTGSVFGFDCFDLALALTGSENIVPNDFTLNAPERFIVITGPNQGGKTTFARAFGQMHYIASLGLCVPGREASLVLFDKILTHFGREEDMTLQNGKLQDDLIRLKELLSEATERSIIIVNEIFVSTTLTDALSLGGYMMDDFLRIGVTAIVVTFLDELALHGRETVSMMSTVEDNDPTIRTFKIIRKPPDGLAYAMHISSKYGLTYEQLNGRLAR